MATTFDELSASFATFKGDFSTFTTNVQAALQQLAGLTPEQQAVIDTVNQGMQDMDATVKGFVLPSPPSPTV